MPDSWFVVLVFAASIAFYLMLAGSVTWTEGIAAIGVGLATAGFVLLQRKTPSRPIALPMPPARIFVRTLLRLVTDTVSVGRALLGSIIGTRRGNFSLQAFNAGGSNPHDAGRRALVTLAISLAPNSFVVDLRPEADGDLLLHCFATAKPLSDLDWPA